MGIPQRLPWQVHIFKNKTASSARALTQRLDAAKRNWMPPPFLLHRAGGLRENSVGVGTDQANGAHNEHEDDRKHDRIFSDVLPLVVGPETGQ
jgi:hypothetical protein